MNGLKPCSCGGNVFVKTTQVYGTWTVLLTVNADGSVESEGCGDGVRTLRESKYVRCDVCKKRYPNPDYKK